MCVLPQPVFFPFKNREEKRKVEKYRNIILHLHIRHNTYPTLSGSCRQMEFVSSQSSFVSNVKIVGTVDLDFRQSPHLIHL